MAKRKNTKTECYEAGDSVTLNPDHITRVKKPPRTGIERLLASCKRQTLRVYMDIFYTMHQNDFCEFDYCSEQKATDLRVSKSIVTYAIDSLIRNGALQRLVRGGRCHRAKYAPGGYDEKKR